MQSFRSELEDLANPVVERDIVELAEKIARFKTGDIDEEKFRSLRLARGVYGQRQPGVQMIRIKLPYGKMTVRQLLRIADVSDEYSIGRLHTTTRQDIQIHYVSLDRTPQLWAELERDDITLREACGNTVRNVTASPLAGIDPQEAFDVTPYAHATFEYFLRNPVCQDMGRKFKIAFSASATDTALTYMHDLGFLPVLRKGNRGFKVLLGGGLGAQPRLADVASEFLPEDDLIPFTEAVLRVFDRHGERAKRHKARLKFLIKDIGIDAFLKLVEAERKALPNPVFTIEPDAYQSIAPAEVKLTANTKPLGPDFERWLKTNVIAQKQTGYFAVGIALLNGDIQTSTARELAKVVTKFAADDIRVTPDQNLLLRFVPQAALPELFQQLKAIGLARTGFGSTADITSCPGTDTCNLGISNSTGVARALEEVIRNEYPELEANRDLHIKISGCMNSCGQHALAEIGLHGSSLRVGKLTAPALQVLLGGATLGDGAGRLAEKVIKVPSKRGPAVLRTLIDDYQLHQTEGEYYHSYFERKGKNYFYELLKPLAGTENLTDSDFQDWGQEKPYQTAIGVGECAGVTLDLVATLIDEAEEKLTLAVESTVAGQHADAIYHAYAAFINGAKALLVDAQVKTNSHAGILRDFNQQFMETGKIKAEFNANFEKLVLRCRDERPRPAFAAEYLSQAQAFLQSITTYRAATLNNN